MSFVFTFAKNNNSHGTFNEVVDDDMGEAKSRFISSLVSVGFSLELAVRGTVCTAQVTQGSIPTHPRIKLYTFVYGEE